MDALLKANPKIDVVYAHNDPMAEGAYLAAKAVGREKEMKFIGIDALPIPSGGIKAVEQGRLSATFTYPTNGKEAIAAAKKILVDCGADREVPDPAHPPDRRRTRPRSTPRRTRGSLTTRRGPSQARTESTVPVRIAGEVSMRDVALHAGVSVATVSRVLNASPTVRPEARDRVNAAIAELGYRPNRLARNLRRQTAEMIGIVVSDIENPHFTAMVRAVEDAAFGQGYRLLLCNSDEQPAKQRAYLEMLAGERVSGVILSPPIPAARRSGSCWTSGSPSWRSTVTWTTRAPTRW